MTKHFTLLFAFVTISMLATASVGLIRGVVKDKRTQQPLPYSTVVVEGTALGATADTDGAFTINEVPYASYNIKVQLLGYEPVVVYDVVVSSGNSVMLNVEMEPSQTSTLKEITIRRNPYAHNSETPLSIQSLSAQEIKSNPGGNFDISRAIQGFPGVGGTAGSVGGYRNDLIIRGGAPNENVYYLDGIEVPVINHFATQGSAGGPTGIINISFINDVELYTSAFPARYDNPLSGVLVLQQKMPNPEKIENSLRLSATELAYSADGPISDKLSFQFSARRSYLQFLFQALQIPIQPSYWDFQYKLNYKISKKLSFFTLGIGAIDDFSFITPSKLTPENVYILHSNPLINQWNYTNGYGLKKLIDKGYWNLTFSRNMLNNKIDKYLDNQAPSEPTRTLKIHSTEAETKLRFEEDKFYDRYNYSFGVMTQIDEYSNDYYVKLTNAVTDSAGTVLVPAVTVHGNSSLSFLRYGLWGQFGWKLMDNRLTLSLGLRTDGNTYTTNGNDISKQISPRLSASFKLNANLNFNASVGRYYKLPPYTLLGYTDTVGNLVNKHLQYTTCDHYVAGLEYIPEWQGSRITLEGFYKFYSNYPVSLSDGISLANKGGDFNVLGNEPVSSTGNGNSYGLEVQVQQKLLKNFFVVFSLTQYRSLFTNADGKYVAASWDDGTLVSFIGGYKLRRNYEVGVKFRYQGGAPYSPFDMDASQRNYSILGTGVLDYTKFNTLRLASFNSMDVRIDKKWNFKKIGLDVFFDITNAYGSRQPANPTFTFKRTADNSTFLTTDGKPLKSDGSNGIPLILDNSSVVVIPSIGFILDF
jgi:TonB dependent receptor/CarboxypepD_reg-like domain/TonB-dependent Receptor Plug Domain